MHKNQIWLAFLSTTALVVLWFTAVSGYELYTFFALNSKTLPVKMEWTVKGRSSDRFYLSVEYQYRVKDDIYTGESGFESTTYRNTIAADKALNEQKDKTFPVWYATGHPGTSTINKLFPLKSLFYTAILWGLLLYFVWLGFYVGKFKAQTIFKD